MGAQVAGSSPPPSPVQREREAPILELRGIVKLFHRALDLSERLANLLGAGYRPITVRAVDGVDLAIGEGEVLGLVGESGCGKSTLGRIVAGVLPPTRGDVRFRGRSLVDDRGRLQRNLALRIQMIFQDPFASLNPRLRIREIIGEAPRYHGLVSRAELAPRLDELMRQVGLDPSYLDRYPHQFSGGQRQRIGIARALAVEPEFLVCDEAVAALDVSIQAQILNLFMELRERLGLTYLFISHDLGVVEHISDRIAIMYLGRIVELAPTERLCREPAHPYTRALLADVPRLALGKRRFEPIRGEIPSPADPPPGCAFHPRCPLAFARCREARPELREIAPGHWCACHLHDRG